MHIRVYPQVNISIIFFSHANCGNQCKSSESILHCFYNMFLPLLGHHQVKTRVHCSKTTLANVYMLHLLLFCRLYTYTELKIKIKIELD
jgi:hypothetical protein